MSDILGVEIEALMGIGLAVGGIVAFSKLASSLKQNANNLPGGNNSPVNQNPPSLGTTSSPPYNNAAGAGCEGPFFAPGTTIGKQVFLAPGTRPTCSGLTYANFLYSQEGYMDPSSNQPVDDGVNYQVWRCLNQVTHIDDGWFYMSPNCPGNS